MASAATFFPFRAGGFTARLAYLGVIATLTAVPIVMSAMTARSFEAVKAALVIPLALLAIPGLLAAIHHGRIRDAAGAAPVTFAALAVLMLSLALSTVLSETQWIAFFGGYLRREGLISWLICGLIFVYVAAGITNGPPLQLLLRIAAVASVVPCSYTLVQVLGHDFFVTGGIESSGLAVRPGGTFGNPGYLGAYLLLMIPIGVHALLSAPGWPARALWAGVLTLQLAAIALTQSRGPLAGLAAALALMGLLVVAAYRSRHLMHAIIALLVAGLALAILAWGLAPVNEWLRGMPVAGRWLTSDTVSIRTGVWRMGIDTLRDAPALRLLLGYGPDVAYFSYYEHIPYPLLAMATGHTETIDRLHNDLLDLAANGGLLAAAAYAVFVFSLVYHAAQRIFALEGIRWAAALTGISVLCAIATAGAATGISGNRAWIPAALGLGFAAGWILFFGWQALRGLRTPRNESALTDRLLAGALVAAVVGYWVDSQVGVPTFATRIVFFATAASLLCVLRRLPGVAREGGGWELPGTVAAVACGATVGTMLLVSSFFPAEYNSVIGPPGRQGAAWKLLVIALFLAACHALIRAQPSERGDPWRLTTSIAAPLGVFFALYCAIAWTIGGAPDSSLDLRMAALPAAAGAASATACVGFSAYPAPGKTAVRAAPRDGVAALACVAILFLLAGMLGYREIRSDILSKLAAWSYKKGDADRALSFLERAAVLMPREKNHGLAIGTRRLEQVAVRLASPDTRAGGETDLDALLEQAEAPIRAAYSHAPRDPSAMLALANVLQFRALSILRPGIGAQRSEAAAAEARELFSLAHRRFPAHPLTLRNWAQFEFDQGNAARAFDLLDRLEAFDLRDPVSHAERLRMAAALGDPTLVEAALDRAARSLDADGMKELHKLLIQRK